MTDDRDKTELELEGLVRDLPSGPPPSADFAANLREAFSTGGLAPGAYADVAELDPADLQGAWREDDDEDELADSAERISGSDRANSSGASRGANIFSFPTWARALTVSAVAAAAILFFALDGLEPNVSIQARAQGNGTLSINGETFSIAEFDEVKSRLQPGVSIHLDGDMSAVLDLVYPGFMAVQVTPGVEMTVPKPASRWLNRKASFEVEHGEVRVVTGPDFADAGLSILAPGAEIEITGTTFAVICSPCSTCVCVLEGVAEMSADGGPAMAVKPGHRTTIFNDTDQPPLDEPIRGEERMKLEMLRDSAVDILNSGAKSPKTK